MDLSQRALFFILFCVIYGIASTSYGVDCNAAVDIQQGTLQGQAQQRKGFEACSYKGIPYAKAPVGELRWRAPQAANSFEGVYQAKQFGPECYQNITSSRLQGESFSERISEDCLHLNIWQPKDRKENEKLPVFFWMHGGALVLGSNAWKLYEGSVFSAKQRVIVVSINYRLGYLGYLSNHSLLDKNDGFDGASSGNYGLLDQIAALEWVYKNIESFGGDPANVTIAGESAGGWSVSYLLSYKPARKYFHKAIMQSGASNVAIQSESAFSIGDSFSKKFNCHESKNTAECLRALDVEAFVNTKPSVATVIYNLAHAALTANETKWRLVPRIDEKLLANKPEQIYQQEDFRTIPILGGSTLKDPSFLIKSTQKTVQDFSSLGEKHTYLYRFDYDDHFLGWLIGGVHGFELPLVFDTTEFASLGDGALYAYQDLSLKRAEKLSHKVQAYWGNFMRTGNPNGVDHEGNALANWPVYSENKPDLLVLDRPFKIERMK